MSWRRVFCLALGLLSLAALIVVRSPRRAPQFSRSQGAGLASTPSLPFAQKSLRAGASTDSRFPYRLTNTAEPLNQLLRNPRAILLENGLLDTTHFLKLPIPPSLQAAGEPGSYIVQAVLFPLTAGFRHLLESEGAQIVAYIPNNAFLVRASGATARTLERMPQVQAVIPYEPYFKLKGSLLSLAVAPGTASDRSQPLRLNALLFPGGSEATLEALKRLNIPVLGEQSSPFGPVLALAADPGQLSGLAGLDGVQELERWPTRTPANDLSRVTLGVSTDPVTTSNYLGLTGANVLVNVNDTGVDASQPDLAGRVSFDLPSSGQDANGHGTHVAGIIAGDGSESTTVTGVPGSPMPPSPFQFRGMAPGATLFSIAVTLEQGSTNGDAYLQQSAANANALISNNSWSYAGDYDYDLAAASYDAAVRDALPSTPGPQPMLFVFAAGNSGRGNDDGTGGIADSIESPATAKNVITVGAIEQFRAVTNQTWTCSTNGGVACQTNEPWLGATDSSNQVAAFSSRGNVGPGIEGASGRFKPDVVAPGTFVVSTRSSQWDQAAYYAQTNSFLSSSQDANYSEVLSNLNQPLGLFYRFESGTSLAAADVSGTLALMEQFYRDRLGLTNSPALTKALLINGARSLGAGYDLAPSGLTNRQGWGLIRLPTSAPALLTNSASGPMLLFDQNPANALATGEAQTRFITVSPDAQSQPLRVTLVWTDPPGDPVAGVKLVNNLDLMVTNLDTGAVFFGNDIPAGQEFNTPWDTHSAPNLDLVNNTENVFLQTPVGAHFSVTVNAASVNVNAVATDTNDVVQDYALVISSGDGQVADALAVTNLPPVVAAAALVTTITNGFGTSPFDWGAVLTGQRAGANAPLASTQFIPVPGNSNAFISLGAPQQWHFYVVTNSTSYTNAAFLTFDAVILSAPASSDSFTNGAANLAPAEADVDLYVSRDPGLTNLDPQVVAAADMSLGRGGSESVVYSNATAGVYYIGVKSETARAAQFGFAAEFSALPFAQDDGMGNQVLRGFPSPAPLPGGTPALPGAASVFCVEPSPVSVRRVIVTNVLSSPSLADLAGTLAHNDIAVVLNNHSSGGAVATQPFIYDDSGEGDIPGAQPTDGPGSLRGFAGGQGLGQWWLAMSDTNQPGTNESLGICLVPEPDLTAGFTATIQPGGCRKDFIYVPPEATNVTVSVSLNSGQGPLSMQVCPVDASSGNCMTVLMAGTGTNLTLTTDNTSHPPLNPGMYALTLCSSDSGPDSVYIQATLLFQPQAPPAELFASSNAVAIPPDAVTHSTIVVTNSGTLLSAAVGVHIDHPRVSDLVLSLISPSGKRVLLSENRGGASTNGMGGALLSTNTTPVSYAGGPEAVTNFFDTGQTSGSILINYDFYALPDDMRVYYDGQLLYDSGLVSFTGETNLAYGPGNSTLITIVMNQGGNENSNTAWFYQLTSTQLSPLYLTFTDDTNLSVTPIKFAPLPLTNVNYLGTGGAPTNGIFYLPEQPLEALAGETAAGPWTVEIADTRAEAFAPAPKLTSWQLGLTLRNAFPAPLALAAGTPSSVALGAGETQWFTVDAPLWASFASNALLSASAPVTVWFTQSPPIPGAQTGSYALVAGATAGLAVLATNSAPPLLPGTRYYLAVQNTNAAAVTFSFLVNFDVNNVVILQNGMPYPAVNQSIGNATDYYEYDVSTNAVRAQFEIDGPSGNLALVARRGLPLPSFDSYDYLSANPGTNDQLIVVFNYSTPVPLTSGDWFLGVVNQTGLPITYSVMATEFAAYGTNIVITNETVTSSSFCFSWTSLPGVHYYVEGKTSMSGTNWLTISPTLTANDVLTSYCVALPSPFSCFRVCEGLALTTPPISISGISWGTNGVLLSWAAPSGSQFSVEWTPSLNPPSWTSFTNPPSWSNGSFFFLDDGSESQGLSSARYYRLQRMP